MIGSLAEKFVRATTAQPINSRWQRRKTDYLVKRARLTDGEILHLLLGRAPEQESVEDDQFYKSLQSTRAQTLKSSVWLVGSGAFGVLAHFHGLQSASSYGLVVSFTVFNHAALLAISASFAWFSFNFCKQSFAQSWFSAKFRNGSPKLKATLLLKYPDAYFHFNFLPRVIDFPTNIQSNERGYGQLVSLLLILIALVAFVGGSWLLWITVALDVWRSNQISELGTIITLTLSAALVLLGLTSPFRRETVKQYKHHGLVNQLVKLQGEDLQRAHWRILMAARRMGLLDLKEQNPAAHPTSDS